MLDAMVKAHSSVVTMEVSSHALCLARVAGIDTRAVRRVFLPQRGPRIRLELDVGLIAEGKQRPAARHPDAVVPGDVWRGVA